MNATALTVQVPVPASRRLPELDQLKGLAMVLVILYHAGGVLSWEDKLHGELGVDFFVIVTGVLLALRERREGAGAFLVRRLLRLLPAYWIVLCGYWWANAHFLGKVYTPFNLAIHFLGVQGWFGDVYGFAFNDSFWYVTLILTLYLCFLACRRWLDRPGPLVLAGAVICLGFALYFLYTNQPGIFRHLGLRLPGFFVGLLIGQALRTGKLVVSLGAALGLGLFLVTYPPYTQSVVFYNTVVALALMAAYLFAWKRLVFAPLERTISAGLAFLGVHSLEIFLIHQPLIRDYNYYCHTVWLHQPAASVPSMIAGMAVGLAVALVLSVALHWLLGRLPLPGRSAA